MVSATPRLLFILLLIAAVSLACGCANSSDPEGEGAALMRTNDKFATRTAPDFEDETQLLSYRLIQVAPDKNDISIRHDLGYLREEKLIVKVKPWDERDEDGFVVHLPGSFQYPVKNPDGSVTMWEAVSKKFWYVLDLTGRPLGLIDEFGVVRRWNASLNQMEELGYGDAYSGTRLLFGITDDYRFDRENSSLIHTEPRMFVTVLDSQTAQARFERAAVNRFDYVTEIVEISEDKLAQITVESPEIAANFEVGDRLRFLNIKDDEFARWLSAQSVPKILAIESNILITDLDTDPQHGMRGSFEGGKIGIVDEFAPDALYSDPDRIWNR